MKKLILTLAALFLLVGFSKVHAGYDSNVGRWIQRDPIEETGGINLYDYVNNDPIGLVDPSGELGYSPLGWYSIMNSPSIIAYEEGVVKPKAKQIAKKMPNNLCNSPGIAGVP